MKVAESGVTKAYEFAKLVYTGALKRGEAVHQLETYHGLNRNTAGDLLQNYKCFVDGTRYTRCNNSFTTEYYLSRIKDELGEVGLTRAVSAVSQHIDYFESLGKGKLREIRKIRDKYSAMLHPEDMAVYPDDLPAATSYEEGTAKQVYVNVYERNKEARAACLKHYGYNCTVCGFNFEKKYGEAGRGRIHVHHLVEISTIKNAYKIDPVKDLRPVCPNCHMMIHSKQPAYTLGEIGDLLVA
jgi:5-methylcytosine-specific restriction protein A